MTLASGWLLFRRRWLCTAVILKPITAVLLQPAPPAPGHGVCQPPVPGGAHSGTQLWATNLAGNYNAFEDSTITSPAIDLSGQADKEIVISWWQWVYTEANYDFIYTDVSKDGGATWTQIYTFHGLANSWQAKSFTVDSSYAVANFMVRFRFHSDLSIQNPGWYLDDVTVSAREPVVIAIPCDAIQGGLVGGFVTDANNADPLNGVAVASGNTGAGTTSAATPMDDGLNDGFYWMFAPTPPTDQDFFATGPAGYAVASATVGVVDDGIVQQDFALEAGWLTADPTSVSVSVPMGGTTTATLTLDNMGGEDADFELKEIDGDFVPAGPFETPTMVVKPFRQHFESTKGLASKIPSSTSAASRTQPGMLSKAGYLVCRCGAQWLT